MRSTNPQKRKMLTVEIKRGTELHKVITTTAEKCEINPSAFATGILYAALEKKREEKTEDILTSTPKQD